MDIASLFRQAEAEQWLEAALGPSLASHAPSSARHHLSELLSRVAGGEQVTAHATAQGAVSSLALATTDTDRAAARDAVVACMPTALPSPSERSQALSEAVLSVLSSIRAAPSHKRAEELAFAARQPLSALTKLLVEAELPWPTDPQLQQALWDSDREFAAWELLEHFR